MRPAHVLRWLAGAGGLAVTSWLSAQTAAPIATDHNAPTLALQHPSLINSGSIVNESGDWRQANAAVAAFARGHADVIAWEKAQAVPAAPNATPAGSMQMHHHGQHGMQGGQR
ncbi:hypothetical protein GCM10027276_34950 [Comamonas piscis]